MIITPLYGHTSEDTAYLIADYPYGRLRCQMKVWLETDAKKGVRFVSRTENPKNGVWNAPKKSTYSLLAGNMYVDEVGHVQWASVHEYSDACKVREFITAFPENTRKELLKVWVCKKIAWYKLLANGEGKMTINGVVQEPSQFEQDRYVSERDAWASLLPLMRKEAEHNDNG